MIVAITKEHVVFRVYFAEIPDDTSADNVYDTVYADGVEHQRQPGEVEDEEGARTVWGVESDFESSYIEELERDMITEAFAEVARLKEALL